MNIELKIPENFNIDKITLQKMIFLYNAIQEGWNIKKENQKYIFTKKHEDKREIFLDTYLNSFLNRNIEIKNYNNQ
tara:strand:- start:121 stop:348 length:228 start_codon:yes stop_codon:yes gene_type:complete